MIKSVQFKIVLVLGLSFFTFIVKAQTAGEWTWMNGINTMNYMGNYGVMGVASPTNHPPGVYEGIDWTDDQGNFWFYGGFSGTGAYDNLWKYEITTNQWTWVKGSGNTTSGISVYGIRGIAAATNSPGPRGTSASWNDHLGNLWLYGGVGNYVASTGGTAYSDLWRYNILSNKWTWMKGDSLPYYDSSPGSYGIKGVASIFNNPVYQVEMGLTWTSATHDLYMLDEKGCMWKYSIASNMWIWMNGNTSGLAAYGQLGIASASNTPGTNYFSYTRWTDQNNDFWLYAPVSNRLNGIFKYSTNTNMWTRVWGDTTHYTYNISHYCDSLCDYTFIGSTDNLIPPIHWENRACWIDECSNLWLMGGYENVAGDMNDLIYFDTSISKWIRAGNDTLRNYNAVYGTVGISSSLNKPASRAGALPFKDSSGNLWLYGGLNDSLGKVYADLWRYSMDMGCPPCHNNITVNIPKLNLDSKKFTVNPNPFRSSATIIFTEKQFKTTLMLKDIMGKEVKQWYLENSNKLEIEKGQLTPGVYLLQAIDSRNVISFEKVIIQ